MQDNTAVKSVSGTELEALIHQHEVTARSVPTSRGLSAGSSDVAKLLDSADKPRNVGTDAGSEQLQHEIIFVDFWATWCAPCRQFGIVFEQVALKHPDVVFAKINIEEEHALAETFNIRSIPHLMVFKQGIVIYSEAGSMPESALTELVQQAITADVSKIREEIDKET